MSRGWSERDPRVSLYSTMYVRSYSLAAMPELSRWCAGRIPGVLRTSWRTYAGSSALRSTKRPLRSTMSIALSKTRRRSSAPESTRSSPRRRRRARGRSACLWILRGHRGRASIPRRSIPDDTDARNARAPDLSPSIARCRVIPHSVARIQTMTGMGFPAPRHLPLLL